jgi:polysaccharide pyruvyl transferase CsaB
VSNAFPTSPPFGPRILVCGWAGAGNIGDELLTTAVVERLQEGGARVVVASRDPAATEARHRGVEAVPWGPRGLRHMGSIDGVCVGPGGILQDSSSVWNLPGHLVMPWRARRKGAAIAVVGVGAEPLRRRTSAWMLRKVLAGAPVVTRDPESCDALAAAGVASTAGADVVFGLSPPDVERRAEIVVSVGPSSRPGRLAPAARRLDPAPVELIARSLDDLATRLECRVVLTRFRGRRDHDTARAIAARLVTEHEIVDDDVDEHVRRVGAARVVVSSRYHPIVLAVAARTPVLALSTQSKVISLIAQVDDPLARRVASWPDLAAAAVPSPVSSAPIPSGLDAATRALGELVRAAGAPRGDRRGG